MTLSGEALEQQYCRLKEEHPHQRAREAAAALGVSEAALVACGIPHRSMRLAPDWPALWKGLIGAGRLMLLTRNDHAVHEKKGVISNLEITPAFARIEQAGCVLELKPHHLAHAFSCKDPIEGGRFRRSIQLFDAEGRAVHKIYAQNQTDQSCWDDLVTLLAAVDQSNTVDHAACDCWLSEPRAKALDDEALAARWRRLVRANQIAQAPEEASLERVDAIEKAWPNLVRRLAPSAAREMLEGAADLDLSLICTVSNNAATQTHIGPVRKIKQTGTWANVLDPDFNLHLSEPGIDTCFSICNPTKQGAVVSLELFDGKGESITCFRADPSQTPEAEAAWQKLQSSLSTFGT